jgi:hypothetical protein
MSVRNVCAAVLLCTVALSITAQALTPGVPMRVQILYDNSGSMYAGYRPPGSLERRTRQELGVPFFHQSPAFARWLDDFVQNQSIVDGGTIGMSTFTSDGQFTPADIREVHAAVPLRDFDVAAALTRFPPAPGNNTYLTETLETFSHGFTGLVWLITDNIVEANDGEPDAGVRRFFEVLAQRPEFRSVHLFKYPVAEGGQEGALAVYGILVSAADVPAAALAQFDAKFRRLNEAKRRDGDPPQDLFPGREYLKLKDLRISIVKPELRLLLDDTNNGTFNEGQNVELQVEGKIRSLLTQHTVTGGRYELAIAAPFVAEEWAQRNLGARALAPGIFAPVGAEIQEEIPPDATREIAQRLSSSEPVAFTPSNVAEWLRLAWNGATVRYTGMVRMTFADVTLRLEPQRMAGIFGIDQASTIFDFQRVGSLAEVAPCDVPVSFALRTGSSRTAILLSLFALLAVILGALGFLLSRKQIYRITISNAEPTVAALRPLGSHNVLLDGKPLGRLWRGITGGYGFQPANGNPKLIVAPATEAGSWDIRIPGESTRRLSIKAEGGGTKKLRTPSTPSSRAAPPPPPLPRNAPPPGRPPKIGRL